MTHPSIGPGMALLGRLCAIGAVASVAMLAAFGLASYLQGDRPLSGPLGEGGWTARSRGWLTTRGTFPAELEPSSARHFTWTRTRGAFVVPGLDRRDAARLVLDVRGLDPAAARTPQSLIMTVDGVAVSHVTLTGRPQRIVVPIATRGRTGVVVGFSLSHGFVPGPQDPRELGMIVDQIGLAPREGARWPVFVAPLWRALLCGWLLAAALALVGGGRGVSMAAAAAGGAGTASLLIIDGAFFGAEYPRALVWLHVAGLAAGAAVAAARTAGGLRMDAAARAAVTIVFVVGLVRAGVFLHPHVTVGDSIFHVHRAELVARGSYFFTSVTPRPFFEFPYAPGLYVTAMPLWRDYPDKLDRARLLRMIAIAADLLVALAVFVAVRRHWGATAALAAASLHQLIPIGLHTLCTSNLTNAFAQSVFALGLGLALGLVGRVRPLVWAPVLAIGAAVGFLSHFSTLSTGVPILLAIALALCLTRATRRAGVVVALALVAALAVSYVVYYSHFHEVYRTTFARVLAREGEAPARSMVAPVGVKLSRFVHAVRHEYFGLPLAAAALAGVAVAVRRRQRDPLTLAAAGWLAVVVAFFGLGIFTPIEMRAALAGQALVAALAGLAFAAAWDGSRPWQLAAGLLAVTLAVRGVSDWLLCLGLV